jgi:hypothetical protein
MSMKFLYHGEAIGVDALITEPGPHRIDGHAKCGLPNRKSGRYTGHHPGFEIPEVFSHGECTTEVHAMPEDSKGYFRTEIRATVKDLNVEGGVLTVDRITLGIVTVYRRDWNQGNHTYSRRTRVLPFDCKLVNLRVKGRPLGQRLPAPFHYSEDLRESYLHRARPLPKIDAEIRKTIIESPSRFVHIPNFGRIYFGEWTIVPSATMNPVHQINMLRLTMGSPQTGGGSGGSGGGGGEPSGNH